MTKISGEHEEPEIDPYAPELHIVSGPDFNIDKPLIQVKERKPKKDEYVRVHPDLVADYGLYEFDDGGQERERFLVLPKVRYLLDNELMPHRVHVAINRYGEPFIWAIKLPQEGNVGGHTWLETALMCAEQAKHLWIKVKSNRAAGMYEAVKAQGELGDPEWPRGKNLRDFVELAFKGKVIDRPDHPVLLKMSGER